MKILGTYQSTAGSLDYNERKVAAGAAAVIGVRNIPGTDMLSIRSVFERLERRNIRSRDVSFQMAMNPNEKNPSERYTDGEAMRMAEEVMGRLGYGGQPFVVFRHNDISREHFHVISIRVNEQGRKINDFYEDKELQKIMKELKQEFHFEIGDGEGSRQSKHLRAAVSNERPVRFSRANGSVREQFLKAFSACMSYDFSSFMQFADLMNECGFRVEFLPWMCRNYLAFQGLDKTGRPSTRLFDDKEICLDLTDRVFAHVK